jgi:hypothetical protein
MDYIKNFVETNLRNKIYKGLQIKKPFEYIASKKSQRQVHIVCRL